jgi:hypothetical protein
MGLSFRKLFDEKLLPLKIKNGNLKNIYINTCESLNSVSDTG